MKTITAFIIIAIITLGVHAPGRANERTEALASALNTINEIKTIDTKIKHLSLENLNLVTRREIRAEIASERRSELSQILADKGETFDVIEAQKELILALYKLVGVIIDVDNNKMETIELLHAINEELGNIATVSLEAGTTDIDKSSERKYREAIDVLNSLKAGI